MSKGSIQVVVVGASGRMGRSVLQVAMTMAGVQVTAAIVSPTSVVRGMSVDASSGGLSFQSELEPALAGAEVIVDFSSASAVSANLAVYERAARPLLVGTTGLDAACAGRLSELAHRAPVMLAPNTSIGVTVLIELVRRAAAALPNEFDIEILEAHHKAKQDLPSGTALALGAAAAEGRGVQLERAKTIRSQSVARTPGEIGFAALRGGDIVGKHSVLFAGSGEILSLGHEATDRRVFAVGALHAARWLARQDPGLYKMKDFIGL